VPLNERQLDVLNQPGVVIHLLDSNSPIPDADRSCLLGLGITSIDVSLKWDASNLVLQVEDNGSGISRVSLDKSEGFGLRNMRARASHIGGKLEIQTAADHGTSVIVTVPISS